MMAKRSTATSVEMEIKMESILHLVQILFWLFAAFAVLALGRRFAGTRNGSKRVKKLGFLHVHPNTEFTRRASIASRRTANDTAGDTTDDELGRGNRYAVLRFSGDVKASGKEGFALLVDEVLANKDKFKAAIVVVNSPGGGVAEYGQMYAEMLRLRKAEVDLTVCVDTYAASGGYLMSLPANRICAAPWSIVGSVGVVSEFPNFHKFLKRLGIEPLTLTAGNMKRTITPLSDPDDEAKKQAYEQKLAKIHEQFKALVVNHRPQVNPDLLNGDSWSAAESMQSGLGLVDELATSQEYLFRVNQENDLIHLGFKRNPFEGGLLRLIRGSIDYAVERVISRIQPLQ